MLTKCSLKAFEIPTGLLICWPFTSMKEKLVGLGLVGATCLSIFHSFFGLFMFSMNLPFQLCLVRSLSPLLDSYPFSPFSWCCRRSSRRRFISSYPLQDNSAMSRASHLAHVSVLGRPKLKLNSVLKIFLYVHVYRDIFIFSGWGRENRSLVWT